MPRAVLFSNNTIINSILTHLTEHAIKRPRGQLNILSHTDAIKIVAYNQLFCEFAPMFETFCTFDLSHYYFQHHKKVV